MVKKLIQICKDMDWALDSKNEKLLPSYRLSICNSFYFRHPNLMSSALNLGKSLCNANFMEDVTPFFALFVLIFMSADGDFGIFLQYGEFR